MFKRLIFLVSIFFSTTVMAHQPIHIVAAENFYGEIAKQIGGEYVEIYSIMNNPNQDPHLFSANMTTAKAVADADFIIYNGLGYDPWMENLISANADAKESKINNKNNKQNKQIMIVADLINKKSGDNPHIWYDPNTMLVYAEYLNQKLIEIDPVHKLYYQARLEKFENNYRKLQDSISHLKNHHQDTAVIATEPVFNYMAKALDLKMYGLKFQLNIMNSTSPSAEESKDFENKLKFHQVKLLIYNKQVSNPMTQRMQRVAKKYDIPVIGVTESQPMHQDYITWMNSQLLDLDKALTHVRD